MPTPAKPLRSREEDTDWKSVLRDEVWALQDRLREITRDKAAAKCGVSVVEGAATLMKGGGKDGQGHFGGLSTCAKIHLCPVCAGRIRAGRADEMQAYVQAWEGAGHGVVLVTFTLRHFERHTLKELVKIQTKAWARSFGAKAGKMWVRMKDQFGINGYARSWECTRGPAGWHPHWHVLLFVDQPWDETTAAEFSAAAYARWSTAVVKEGGYAPSKERGVRVDLPKVVDAPLGELSDGAKMARYLVKTDEGMKWRLGAEMNRGDVKSSKKPGHRTPFEILGDTANKDRPENEWKQDIALWREFEVGSHGIRALYYSSKIKELLDELVDVEEQSDADLADPAEEGAVAIAVFPTHTWYPHVTAHKGRRLELVKAAERNGQPAVRRLIERWGLVWGEDVLPPTVAVDAPGAAQDNARRLGRVEGRDRIRTGPTIDAESLQERTDAVLAMDKSTPRRQAAARRLSEQQEARRDAPRPGQISLALGVQEERPSGEELEEIQARIVATNRRNVQGDALARLRASGRLG